ncbi:uncharacterized protein BCR38DRAFT_482300 [Pseudomassariella vexata]|uniref:Polyamine transport protein n=1 Tax=Pseudomassariella vexata TaxID=1141098 RepID=A0A1Y2EDD7_9PEZI|nr:uncharacterized protein BCR38DRAFT_482300 [Pseudomassariella vexata]ORY68825.1 hypothetical protein BCR38DRAFT_482300 [Pseudomassariella vexata]
MSPHSYMMPDSRKATEMEPTPENIIRPQTSAPSLKVLSNRPASFRSTNSRSGAYRHALLKSEASRQQSTERDLPVPPVLTQVDTLASPAQDFKRDLRFSNVPVPRRHSSEDLLAVQDSPTMGKDTALRPEIVCTDSDLHSPSSHSMVNHPVLVKGDVSCDEDITVDQDSPTEAPNRRRISPEDLSDAILTGRNYRTLTGGDLCEVIVDVTEHIHGAIALRSSYFPNETHEGHVWVEKVQSYHGSPSDPLTSNGDVHSIPRCFIHPNAEQNIPLQAEETSKAASYWGFLPTFGEKKQEPQVINDESDKIPVEDGQEAQGLTNSGMKPLAALSSGNISHSTPSRKNQESPQRVATKSHDLVQPESPASIASIPGNPHRMRNGDTTSPSTTVKQENAPQGEVSTTPEPARRSFTVNVLQERLQALQLERGDPRRSTICVSPPSRSDQKSPGNALPQPIRRFIPEGLDTKRTLQWLREQLKNANSRGPKLTKRPMKLHPRHQDHGHSRDDLGLALASRVTTFSDKDAADVGAMQEAMQNLEQILSEALDIANEVAERDEDGQVDDGHLHQRSESMSEVFHDAPSVHESVASDSNTDYDGDLTGALMEPTIAHAKECPALFVGAVQELSHGCEASPLGSVKRHGLDTPDMRSGNVRGPALPDRGSSLRARKHVGKRLVRQEGHRSDSPFLPMPPPDNQLRRDCAYPAPHAYDEDDPSTIREPHTSGNVPNSREVREYIRVFHQPPIVPRDSSKNLREAANNYHVPKSDRKGEYHTKHYRDVDGCSLDGGASDEVVDFLETPQIGRTVTGALKPPKQSRMAAAASHSGAHHHEEAAKRAHDLKKISLRGRSHVSIKDVSRFSLMKLRRRQTIARNWSPVRKRFVAAVACISTALIGVLIGIYAGLVPSIQYYIADFDHYAILGNVGLYLGMAIPTLFCWPLPLLHGRKPYILSSLAIAMPLLFPQAITVSAPRSPYTSAWRWALLLPRALMGVSLGFASMNFHSILTDLFGASLMSRNPHQEVVDEYDVRRHGGGLGVWLGIWTWCFIGSLGVGFLVGAVIIDNLPPSWGLYISIILIAVVLILNVLTPEVRRSAWRRSVAEVRVGSQVSRRVGRGEIMMSRVKDGPKWWGQEVYHGVALSLEMLRQPGFAVIALYSAWIYAQVVLIIVLLGSLTSRYYRFRASFVGAAVSSVAIGALAAVPFQKANLFSRSRYKPQTSSGQSLDQTVTWTSHLVRRVIFTIILPIAGVMVTAGYAIIHGLGFVFAAGATGIGGMAQRTLGQRAATAVVASILFVMTVLLLAVLVRFRKTEIIPRSRSMEMDKWTSARRDSMRRRASAIAAAKVSGQKDLTDIPEEDVGWRPLIIGNPSEKHRRMNFLELGSLTRWSEIRKKNRLIDQGTHLNRTALEMARSELGQMGQDVLDDLHRGRAKVGEIVRKVSKRSLRSKRSYASSDDEQTGPRNESRDVASTGTGLGHGANHNPNHNPTYPADVFIERECVMGQTVPEEAEESSSVEGGGTADDEYLRRGSRDHTSHMVSKVRPYTGFAQQEVRGGRLPSQDYVVDTDVARRGHASHTQPKVQPADPDGLRLREAHGAHMESKVKPADLEDETSEGGQVSLHKKSR